MGGLVLVTGGAGFIGSHLVEALVDKGYQVRVIDNLISGSRSWVHPAAEFMDADIGDPESCVKAVQNVEGIFHLAAMSRVTPSSDNIELGTRTNIVGTQNLLLAARQQKIHKFIYSGSSTYYGNRPIPHREYETPSELLNFYALTKGAGERYCQLFDQLFDVPTVILRYFNVYGPRQPRTGAYALVLGIFLERWKNGQPLVIHGDGSQRRDFVHVLDVVQAIIAAYESDVRAAIFNVGSATSISIKELADLISIRQIHEERRRGDSNATLADISRIRMALNWQPTVAFEDGLEELKQLMQDTEMDREEQQLLSGQNLRQSGR